MFSQRNILQQYLRVSSRPTLKSISQETGIQFCRVFRLLNGSPMKLSEYEKFSELVVQKMGLAKGPNLLAEECLQKLSPQGVQDLVGQMERMLMLHRLKEGVLG